jgi:hypothetical protein
VRIADLMTVEFCRVDMARTIGANLIRAITQETGSILQFYQALWDLSTISNDVPVTPATALSYEVVAGTRTQRRILRGPVQPEGVVIAKPGTLYIYDLDMNATPAGLAASSNGTELYRKVSGEAAVGWHALGTRFQERGWRVLVTVPASQTNVAMTDLLTPNGRHVMRAGSIVGLELTLTAARTNGSVTVQVQKSSDGGAVWTSIAGCTHVISGATNRARVTFQPGLYTFANADLLRIVYTTSAGWTPTANDLFASIETIT